MGGQAARTAGADDVLDVRGPPLRPAAWRRERGCHVRAVNQALPQIAATHPGAELIMCPRRPGPGGHHDPAARPG